METFRQVIKCHYSTAKMAFGLNDWLQQGICSCIENLAVHLEIAMFAQKILTCLQTSASYSLKWYIFFFWEAISPFLSFTTVFWLVREYWQISWCLLCSTERHYCYATSRNLQQSLANQSGNTHFPLATRVCQGAFNQSLNLCDWRLYSFKFKHNDIII